MFRCMVVLINVVFLDVYCWIHKWQTDEKQLCFWTLYIILFLFKNTSFQRLDSVSIFRWNVLTWAQSVELVPISQREASKDISVQKSCCRCRSLEDPRGCQQELVLGLRFNPEDGGSMRLLNAGEILVDYLALFPSRFSLPSRSHGKVEINIFLCRYVRNYVLGLEAFQKTKHLPYY